MQVKVFKRDDQPGLEKQINEWLKSEGVGEIQHVTQSNDGTTIYITVWYKEASLPAEY